MCLVFVNGLPGTSFSKIGLSKNGTKSMTMQFSASSKLFLLKIFKKFDLEDEAEVSDRPISC
jgi:hypothetical protein